MFEVEIEVEFQYRRVIRGCSMEKSIILLMRNQIGECSVKMNDLKLFKKEGRGNIERLYPLGKSNNKYRKIQVDWINKKNQLIRENKIDFCLKNCIGQDVSIF